MCFVDAVSTAQGSSQPNQALAQQQITREAGQQQLPQQTQQQQQHSGGNRRDQRDNERHNEVKQQRDAGHADSFQRQVPTANSLQATDKYVGQQGQRSPACTTSDDTSHLSQFQSGSGIQTLASKTKSNQQTASRNMHEHTQADVGFRPQHGRGGVNRAPPGLQQGVNSHWGHSDRATPEGATGQQQDSIGTSPKPAPGLTVGPNSSVAR